MNVVSQRKSITGSCRGSQEIPFLKVNLDEGEENEEITRITTEVLKSRESTRSSQKLPGFRYISQEDDDSYLARIEVEAFKPWGCCPRRTSLSIKYKFSEPEMDDEGFTKGNKLVHALAIHGSAEDITKVINIGKPEHDFNELNQEGFSPLYLAVTHKCKSAVKAILKFPNIDFTFQSPGFHKTVLHRAAEKKLDGICDTILSECPKGILDSFIDLKDLGGRTALYIAAQKGCADIIRSLLSYGANPQIAGPEGKTPLMAVPHFSCKQQSRKALIEAEKNPVSREKVKTQSNLFKFIEIGHYNQIKALIEAGCELT